MDFIKKNTDIRYSSFMDKIGYHYHCKEPIEFCDWQVVFWLRHDVDRDLDHALKMALWEFKNNIPATYFLLHTAEYFDYSGTFADKVKQIVDLGHTIGFHNNVLYLTHVLKKSDILNAMNKPLDFLRGIAPVHGTSSHGEKEHHEKYKIINYQMWSQFDPEKNEGYPVRWPQVSLRTFGFGYEAYFLPFDYYISDSGGNDIGYKVDGTKMFERSALYSEKNIGAQKVIDTFHKDSNRFLQVLVHPEHWVEI